jgi:broad specificity phosphatase PhoE
MKLTPAHPARIILARHGETTANRQGIILGQRDYPLTVEGMAMTRKLAALLPESHPGMIVTSPIGRALASAGIFADKTGWPIQILEGLAELSCGQWEGKPREAVIPGRRFIRSTWEDSPPDGESYQGAETRVKEAIRHINAILMHDTILVVGHAAVNRVFLKIRLNLSPEHAMKIHFSHDTLYDINRRIDGESPSVIQAPGKDRANRKESEKNSVRFKKFGDDIRY